MFSHGDGWYGGGTPILSREETIDNYLNAIKKNLLNKEASIKRLQEENTRIKDEKYKDAEMQEMASALAEAKADVRRGFTITEEESKAIREWKKEHETTKHMNPKGYHGVSGGGYSYTFYPTAIGTSGVCTCSICDSRARKEACTSGNYDPKLYSELMKDWGGFYEFQELC